MIATVKIYETGRVIIPKPIRDAYGVGRGDLVQLQVPSDDGFTSTVEVQSLYRATVPRKIRTELSLEAGDFVEIDVSPTEE